MRKGIVLGVIVLLAVATAFYASASTPNSAFILSSMTPAMHRLNLDTGEITLNLFSLSGIPNMVRINKNRGYAVDSQDNQVTVFDLESAFIIATIALSGSNAWDIAFHGAQTAYVSHWESDNFSVIDLEPLTETDLISCGPDPEGVLVYDGRLYVSCVNYDLATWSYGPGSVEIYDLETLTLENTIWTNNINPQALALDELERLHIVCTGNYFTQWGTVEVYDLQTLNLVLGIPIGGSPGSITITLDGIAFLGAGGWGTEGYIYSYDAITGTILHGEANPIVVSPGVWGVDASRDNHVFACCMMGDELAELNSAGAVLANHAIPGGPQSVAVYDRPELEVVLEPQGTPITIPAGGESFDYDLSLANMADFPVLCDVWIEAVMPGGTLQPIIQRSDVELASGAVLERSLSQYVPGRAPAGQYEYRAVAGYWDTGEELASDSFTFEKAGSDGSSAGWPLAGFDDETVSKTAALVSDFTVEVYPNPFNPATEIHFQLPANGFVNLSIYDISGRQVVTLLEDHLSAGNHRLRFDASGLTSGIYLYRLNIPGGTQHGRLLFLK